MLCRDNKLSPHQKILFFKENEYEKNASGRNDPVYKRNNGLGLDIQRGAKLWGADGCGI